MIIDNGSFENMVSLEMVQKLNLETIVHLSLYKLCGLQQGAEIKVSTRCLISFSIGKNYQNQVWCNVATMDACHILLGRPCLYDNRVIYDGFKHTYAHKNDGNKIVLILLKPNLNALHTKRQVRHFLLNRGILREASEYHEIVVSKDEFNGDLSLSLQFDFV